jgi:hypothetical protein
MRRFRREVMMRVRRMGVFAPRTVIASRFSIFQRSISALSRWEQSSKGWIGWTNRVYVSGRRLLTHFQVDDYTIPPNEFDSGQLQQTW